MESATGEIVDLEVLLGDEAVAAGAIDAGITAAYAYPGTPSTEILEYVLQRHERHGGPPGTWCANEKTAFEQGLGVSFAGRRALVAMKHVGLNVALDPFISSAIVSIHGGLVLAVADDPDMHSSQNEQDSRWLADFARVICLEPSNQQEAYDMTREAFDLSERFHTPVVVRIVTRLAHSRSAVRVAAPRLENDISKVPDAWSWILLPASARRQWRKLLDARGAMREWSAETRFNTSTINEGAKLGVITTGIARNYFEECLGELSETPSHVHVGAYPMPDDAIRRLAGNVERILVLEDGYPYVERMLRGILPSGIEIAGRESGEVPLAGELNPDVVRAALGLSSADELSIGFDIPRRPPQLCKGCPHRDAYGAIKKAIAGYDKPMVTSDIGCYTLGAMPPYSAIETCVCMGASIGIAKGASDAGFEPVIAVLGDSTFLHSGVTPLMDCVAADTNMTVVILDNETVAMTGNQPTILPTSRLRRIVTGIGVDPEHVHVREAHPRHEDEIAELVKREVEHRGISVVILVRECLESVRKRKRLKGVTS
jgi:indolepyruvate ferredoxin oxidoreductase alpha subunit